ncbi:hypothetical protein SLEP1_g5100 [Rubroshorea leprosula]|uniref:Uncharacterized protein n=1 Tax=Rubroshorea leprosula TaxID=152421 RepID=A0AAV5HV79_9ROSI|nr:hypothetical protein SLEP1_g5100 [Rubroshorea leprosula]
MHLDFQVTGFSEDLLISCLAADKGLFAPRSLFAWYYSVWLTTRDTMNL